MNPPLLSLDRTVLKVFAVVGAVWVFGLAVSVLLFDQGLVPVAAVYVAVFTFAIASRRIPTELALLVAWAVAVVATGAMMYRSGGLPGDAAVGRFLGAGLFALWVLPSFLVLRAIDER